MIIYYINTMNLLKTHLKGHQLFTITSIFDLIMLVITELDKIFPQQAIIIHIDKGYVHQYCIRNILHSYENTRDYLKNTDKPYIVAIGCLFPYFISQYVNICIVCSYAICVINDMTSVTWSHTENHGATPRQVFKIHTHCFFYE